MEHNRKKPPKPPQQQNNQKRLQKKSLRRKAEEEKCRAKMQQQNELIRNGWEQLQNLRPSSSSAAVPSSLLTSSPIPPLPSLPSLPQTEAKGDEVKQEVKEEVMMEGIEETKSEGPPEEKKRRTNMDPLLGTLLHSFQSLFGSPSHHPSPMTPGVHFSYHHHLLDDEPDDEEDRLQNVLLPAFLSGASSSSIASPLLTMLPSSRVPVPAAEPNEPKLPETDQSTKRCAICMERAIATAILECQHAIMCITCARTLILGNAEVPAPATAARCPCCRKKIQRIIKLFTS